jgi:hypothetical protein
MVGIRDVEAFDGALVGERMDGGLVGVTAGDVLKLVRKARYGRRRESPLSSA